VMVDDLRVAAGQKPEGAARANDVHRLPEAVQHEHGLVERGFHTGAKVSVGPRGVSRVTGALTRRPEPGRYGAAS